MPRAGEELKRVPVGEAHWRYHHVDAAVAQRLTSLPKRIGDDDVERTLEIRAQGRCERRLRFNHEEARPSLGSQANGHGARSGSVSFAMRATAARWARG